MKNSFNKKFAILLLCFLTGLYAVAQDTTNWRKVGNTVSSGDFIGSTNSAALFFRTANQQRMSISAAGILQVNSLAGTGSGMVFLDASGVFQRVEFSGNVKDVLTGDGSFHEVSSISGWTAVGNDVHTTNTGNVGIGVSNPGYKLDVNGTVRLSSKTYVYRLLGSNGDSTIRFGDSTMVFNYNTATIFNTNSVGFRGLGLGVSSYGAGLHSTAIGNRVIAASDAENAIVIGSGVTNSSYLINPQSNTLVVGFNSTIPTFFVGSASGAGTIGKVGVGTSDPQAMFQVGDGLNKINAGPASNVGTTYSTAYMGFNAARTAQGQWQSQGNGSGNGGVVMLSDINGGLRIANIPTTGGLTQAIGDGTLQANTLFYIRSDGRVIIGNQQILSGGTYDNSSTRMTVNGRIMCKDLVVSTVADWPDFAFDSSYVLMPMDSLGQFILSNKHLPGTPAASVLEQNGVSIYETCRQQQLQIEELTLYILQLNERMKALEAEKQKSK